MGSLGIFLRKCRTDTSGEKLGLRERAGRTDQANAARSEHGPIGRIARPSATERGTATQQGVTAQHGGGHAQRRGR